VPVTVAVAWLVCAVVIVAGLAVTDTDVIVGFCGGELLVPLLPHATAIIAASTAAHTLADQRIARMASCLSSAKPILWSIVRVRPHASMCPPAPFRRRSASPKSFHFSVFLSVLGGKSAQ
jgi:hypothetical protein